MYYLKNLLTQVGFECSIERLPGKTTKIISVKNCFGQVIRLWYGYTSSSITRMIPDCVKDEGIDYFFFEKADNSFSIGLIEKLKLRNNGKTYVKDFPLYSDDVMHALIDLFVL